MWLHVLLVAQHEGVVVSGKSTRVEQREASYCVSNMRLLVVNVCVSAAIVL